MEDLQWVPTLREIDVRGAGGPGGPALVLRPREDDLKAVASPATLWRLATSVLRAGPTGKRRAILVDYKPVHLHRGGRDRGLTIAYSRSDLDRLHLTGARAAAVLGIDASDYLVSAVPSSDRLRFWGLRHLALATSMLAAHPRTGPGSIGAIMDSFERLPVTAVAVLPREAADLAGELAAAGTDVSRVRTVMCVGPPPREESRAAILDAWRAAGASPSLRVLALWGPSAGRALWAECSDQDGGTGLHTYPDLDLVEVVDPAGRPAGAAGDLTYTSLGWNGTALVRYQTGAYVAEGPTSDPCPVCGRTVPRIVGAVRDGAWEPRLTTPGGRFTIDLRGAARVLATARGVDAWLIRLRRSGANAGYAAHIVGEADADRRSELGRRLRLATGHPPSAVELIDREELARHGRGTSGIVEEDRDGPTGPHDRHE